MKGTEQFNQTIKAYLDERAKNDELFKVMYEKVNRPIEEITTFIINEVKKSGRCGFADEEIFGLAIHAAETENLEIGKSTNCSVVINRHIELTDQEKAEQKALALKRFQDEEYRKLEQRNKPKVKPQVEKQPQASLFDDF